MINLQPMSSQHLKQVSELHVADEQLKFVGTMEEILVNVDDKIHPHVMVNESGHVVGFFLIDTTYSEQHGFAAHGALGLRAFFVDSRYQGKGYGKQAVKALHLYLQQDYATFESIYLTVNCKNSNAYRCYELNGFKDHGERYHGGAAGPQHIMEMSLT
ncbi:GNAT family N-acetyltransferase [Vibrio sp. S9_S30]|uniref:GNAT family N-acetyltransferase n=1 Tax=Vibrio sp. S9_S30 TaxID=2720226 RepID=UPI00168090FE|nr:GNAT family N-acetyltransferase [Vibrio sp. S9_S30]MBD1556479.1 GNAT family N-acetyltransferase [Vibrio sp. S9_S30]